MYEDVQMNEVQGLNLFFVQNDLLKENLSMFHSYWKMRKRFYRESLDKEYQLEF